MVTKRILPAVLLCIMVLAASAWAQAATREAHIIAPSAGERLGFGGSIEIALQGLSPERADWLLVEVWARPQDGHVGWQPITQRDGASLVPVAGDMHAPDESCAWLIWTDRRAGEATVHVRWKHEPRFFAPGTYDVRADIYVDSRGILGVWAKTAPHTLRLEPHAIGMELDKPSPGSEYTLGSVVPVAGEVAEATFPVQIQLEVRGPAETDVWRVVAQEEISKPVFTLEWDTSDALSELPSMPEGEYSLRLQAEDAVGERAMSTVIAVLLSAPPGEVLILVNGEYKERAEVYVGDPVQFGLRTEPQGLLDELVSFEWDFGDGTVSYAQWPEHTYERGTYSVVLKAYTEPRQKGQEYKSDPLTITVLARPAPAAVKRSIYGYPVPQDDGLMSVFPSRPADSALGQSTAFVRLEIELREAAVGFSVTEKAPSGWEIIDKTAVDNPLLRVISVLDAEENSMTWTVFSSEPRVPGGTVIALEYRVVVPHDARTGVTAKPIEGAAHVRLSAEREHRVELVPGDSTLQLVAELPVCVAIAYLERGEGDGSFVLRQPAPHDDYLIGRDQIKIAEELMEHRHQQSVPYTAGRVMTPERYLLLRSFYEDEVPVTRCPLP